MFYLDLFRALERHRVRYLLVGGLAMNLHGVAAVEDLVKLKQDTGRSQDQDDVDLLKRIAKP
ncbi:MAG: hypothetical protein HYU77_10250 [Betaproteobacteria bacterium]|nr:hypothetical protein [Betaproteobacteria bacterium]